MLADMLHRSRQGAGVNALAVYAYSLLWYRLAKPVQSLHILPLTNYSAPLAQEQMRFEEL